MKQIGVVGLGRFGMSLAKSLIENRCQVLAIDRDMEKVQKAQTFVTQAVQLDARDEDALQAVGITEMDSCVVAIASDIEASMLATMILKELGMPRVICKAATQLHGRFLEKVGADRIVYPEIDTGRRLGRLLARPEIIDQIEFGKDFGVYEIKPPPSWTGKTIEDLGIRAKFGINILAIQEKKEGQSEPIMNISPEPSTILNADDEILVLGHVDQVKKIIS